ENARNGWRCSCPRHGAEPGSGHGRRGAATLPIEFVLLTLGTQSASISRLRPGSGVGIHILMQRVRKAWAPALFLAAGLAGCSSAKFGGMLVPNQPPTVELSQVPATADTAGTYAYEVS